MYYFLNTYKAKDFLYYYMKILLFLTVEDSVKNVKLITNNYKILQENAYK